MKEKYLRENGYGPLQDIQNSIVFTTTDGDQSIDYITQGNKIILFKDDLDKIIEHTQTTYNKLVDICLDYAHKHDEDFTKVYYKK